MTNQPARLYKLLALGVVLVSLVAFIFYLKSRSSSPVPSSTTTVNVEMQSLEGGLVEGMPEVILHRNLTVARSSKHEMQDKTVFTADFETSADLQEIITWYAENLAEDGYDIYRNESENGVHYIWATLGDYEYRYEFRPGEEGNEVLLEIKYDRD